MMRRVFCFFRAVGRRERPAASRREMIFRRAAGRAVVFPDLRRRRARAGRPRFFRRVARAISVACRVQSASCSADCVPSASGSPWPSGGTAMTNSAPSRVSSESFQIVLRWRGVNELGFAGRICVFVHGLRGFEEQGVDGFGDGAFAVRVRRADFQTCRISTQESGGTPLRRARPRPRRQSIRRPGSTIFATSGPRVIRSTVELRERHSIWMMSMRLLLWMPRKPPSASRPKSDSRQSMNILRVPLHVGFEPEQIHAQRVGARAEFLVFQPAQNDRAQFGKTAAHNRKHLQAVHARHFQIADQKPERFGIQHPQRALNWTRRCGFPACSATARKSRGTGRASPRRRPKPGFYVVFPFRLSQRLTPNPCKFKREKHFFFQQQSLFRTQTAAIIKFHRRKCGQPRGPPVQ